MEIWTSKHMPSQAGRTCVITGTGGLAYEDALALACAGSSVVLAGRNPTKGAEAIARIRENVPGAKVRFEQLDLANLQSVARFATRLRSQQQSLDILINNAGVMVPPQRQVTADGFELQFGTNYLGHFALTAQLLPLLEQGREPRVISVSSVAARQGQINFSDLQSTDYNAMRAYSQSKLACLMFALELQRQSEAAGWAITSIAAHPGVSRTDLLHNAPGRWSAAGLSRSLLWFLFQPAWQGALPTLYAATSPEARGGGYYGPHRLGELNGYPAAARLPDPATDHSISARLWQVSRDLAQVSFDASVRATAS